jgi:hypothetical protein
MFRYSVLNLPPLPPPPELGCGGGDKKCRKSKESPPWVCEKCAKKSRDENRNGGRLMGHDLSCGYEAPDETSESTLDLGRSELSCPVCKAKLAKRKADELGCMDRPPGAPDETKEATLDLGGHDLGCPNAGTASVEAEGELGCDKCQKGKKRRMRAAQKNMDLFPSGRLNLQGGANGMLGQVPLIGMGNGGRGGRSVPSSRDDEDEDEGYWGPYVGSNGNGMLGEVRLAGMGNGGRGGRSVPYAESFSDRYEDYRYCDPSMEICPTPFVGPVGVGIGRTKPCTGRHGYLGQGGQAYGCPVSAPALDPTLNCQRDARGNTVCSNGMYFPPGCPHTPPEQYFSPGIAPDEVHNGILEAKVPAPRAAGSTGAAGVPGAGGAPASTTNILPLAAGGIAAVGLLYAIFR